MAGSTVGLLHPGEMGSALGAALVGRGHRVLWSSEGRSEETRVRAREAGLEDAHSLGELLARSDIVLCVCPPHAARDVASSVGGFTGLYVDANAVAPDTARAIEESLDCAFVDGGIVGPPPRETGTTRLYLSGERADEVVELFAGSVVEARVVSAAAGDASAVKTAYAAWTKGTAALLLATRELARAEGVEPALVAEWRLSIPGLERRYERAVESAGAKGWRWVGEMEEIASAFAAAGLPDGFHRAAADVFRKSEWPHAVPS
jgi:3-hydroxyisobutyrate dehydrogenase-like beta-hydroxyacid dehydrogenase